MKSFLDHLKEEVLPSVQVADGGLDIDKPAVRAAINAALASVTSQPAVTPYVVFNRLSKLLAQYHIILPKRFLEGDKGVEVFELRQFGHRMGMTDSGEFVSDVPTTHYLFLQYGIITPFGITYAKPVVGGMFRVMARLVDKDELDKLIDMAEITMSEEAECMQAIYKANAPKDPLHDITSDPKKVGNKKAVADSQKDISEEQNDLKGACWKGYTAKGLKKKGNRMVPNCVPVEEATDKDRELSKLAAKAVKKGHPVKKLPSGRAEGSSLPQRMAKGPNIEKGRWSGHGKFGLGEEQIDEKVEAGVKETSSGRHVLHIRNPGHSTEYHTISTYRKGKEHPDVKTGKPKYIKKQWDSLKEEQIDEGKVTGSRSYKGSSDRKRKAVQMALGRKHKDNPDWNDRTNPQHSALTLGRKLQKHGEGGALQEKAPPGREKQVLALKKKFAKGSGSPFAIAWSSYKKSKKHQVEEEKKEKTVLVSPKGYKGAGQVTRIPKKDYDPTKHNLASE